MFISVPCLRDLFGDRLSELDMLDERIDAAVHREHSVAAGKHVLRILVAVGPSILEQCGRLRWRLLSGRARLTCALLDTF